MGTWDYNAFKEYDATGNSTAASNSTSGTLTDGDPGTKFFDTTETITGGNDDDIATNDDGTFIGTIDLLNVTWVGIEDVNGKTLFYAEVPPGTSNAEITDAFNAATGGSGQVGDLTLENTSGFTTCFAAGTLIATPVGEVAVERLKAGDIILTASGASIPVKWIGHQTVHKIFTPAERFAPVRIRAGALAEGVPHTDLTVTADHGMLVDGLVVHAAALVNGTSILRVPSTELPERVTYYHIETDGHEAILANGAEAETFVDNTTRRAFDNHAEFVALFGENVPEMEEMDLPRVTARRQLPVRVRQALDARTMAVMADKKATA